ncbi:helix-turn-helix domain-containing protein [Paenibacillus vandeheii]
MRCMLIDDDVPTVDVLCDIIPWSHYGFSGVARAHCIQDAKLLFADGCPDLIVCDIEMPRGSGIEMIQWVREQGHDCAFIFFTCHESFDFASTAIAYNADSYLIKPLDKAKLEAALRKAVSALKWRKRLGEYSQLGQTWLKNKGLVENSFWKDLLSGIISPRPDLIEGEIRKRDLALPMNQSYILQLVSVSRSEMDSHWSESLFHYALSNLSSDIMLRRPNHDRVIPYQKDNHVYIALVFDGHVAEAELEADGELLLQMCKQVLKSPATCYISEQTHISKLAQAKADLERLDGSNIVHRGGIHLHNARFSSEMAKGYELDMQLMTRLFMEKEKVQIVNYLKRELEQLAVLKQLDVETLHSIREDFLQVVYTILARFNLQAHRLFEEPVVQQLFNRSENGIFDWMKWAHLMTERTIDMIRETLQSEGMVERAKRYIQENYNLELTREHVAASVYLTPDYFAKVFKQETGMSMKEYLNEYRIEAAKRMLIGSPLSIGRIATETGYDNISYFSTVFKKLAGETPNAYRARHKPMPIHLADIPPFLKK